MNGKIVRERNYVRITSTMQLVVLLLLIYVNNRTLKKRLFPNLHVRPKIYEVIRITYETSSRLTNLTLALNATIDCV